MSKSRLIWMIVLMSISLIGLVWFQFYWIDTVIKANEERFEAQVTKSLNQIIKKLENESYLNKNSFSKDNSFFQYFNKYINTSTFESSNKYNSKISQDSFSISLFSNTSFSHTYTNEISNESSKINVFIQNKTHYGIDTRYFNQRFEQLKKIYSYPFSKLNKNNYEAFFYRLNPYLLDSILKKELRNNNVILDFEFGVINPLLNKFVVMSDHTVKNELIRSQFKVNLFPNNLFAEVGILTIYFPKKTNYLLQQAWITTSSSGILVLIILFCFGFALHTIFKQKKISEMRNDFINNMTHELKTPISTIGLASEALQDKDIKQNDNLRNRYLKMISDENKRLTQQVEKVLQLALIDKGELKLNLEQLDIHELLEKAISKISLHVENKKGNIAYDFEAESQIIIGDITHILNVFINILDNAVKYSNIPEIKIKSYNEKSKIVILFKDNGIGMKKEDLKRVFDRFFRVSTGNLHNVKGFGLGLSYVKMIVDMHKGTIEAESELNKGTEFKIKFPTYE